MHLASEIARAVLCDLTRLARRERETEALEDRRGRIDSRDFLAAERIEPDGGLRKIGFTLKKAYSLGALERLTDHA